MLKYIRRALGWKDPVNVPQESCIIIVGHTTYWDAFMTILYSEELQTVALIKPQVFEGLFGICATPFLNFFGFLPAPKLENKGTGGVQQIISVLRAKQMNSSYPIRFAISPKGTIQKSPWRSGYKHIANELGWPIKVSGLDYSKRTLTFVDVVTSDQESLQQHLGQFCPFVPSRAEYPILCDYDPCELVYPIDILAVSNLWMLLPGCQALWYGHICTFLQTMITMYISWNYHLSKETRYIQVDSIIAKLGAIYWLYFYPLTVYASIPAIIGLYYYYHGTPRIPYEKRDTYIYYHTQFHIWMSIAAWILILPNYTPSPL